MFISPNLVIFLLLVVIFFREISSGCRQSYITVCDSFRDVQNYNEFETSSGGLIIGSECGDGVLTPVNLVEAIFSFRSYKPSTLIVLRAINKLEPSEIYQRGGPYRNPLIYLTLWGNELGTLEPRQFPWISLKKISLVNNKIDSIKPYTFSGYRYKEMDLSDNLMEVIESDALTSDTMKILTIRNNKLTHIQAHSLPSSLETLNLDKNRLRHVQDNVFGDLVNLRGLTLSHNDFTGVPKINHLKQLVAFDISFNKITIIQKGTFAELDNLKVINLSHNDIFINELLEKIITPGKQPDLKIYIGLNLLSNIHLDGVSFQNQTVDVHGNPFDCIFFNEAKKKIAGHEITCSRYLGLVESPYCVVLEYTDNEAARMREIDSRKMRDIVTKSVWSAQCMINREREVYCNSITRGCDFFLSRGCDAVF